MFLIGKYFIIIITILTSLEWGIIMYYHVSIKANTGKEYKNMIEIDIRNEDEVLNDIVIPYLEAKEFLFDGYFIKSENVERIVIKITEQSAREHASFENDHMPTGLIMHVTPEDIFGYDRYTSDVTKLLFKKAKKQSKMKEVESITKIIEDSVDRSKVFIVHGHDELAQSKAARFVEKLGFETIILHEQVSSGKTIIEKIEKYSNVGFGIVLYTPCDVGAKKENEPKLRTRARQNVVFEHGFLMGKIGRTNVCALVKDDVETPNDISGVVYINMDSHDAWMSKVAKEMQESGYDINMNRL